METLIETIKAAYAHRLEQEGRSDQPDADPSDKKEKGTLSKLYDKFRGIYGVEK
jgi:two-component system NtrC family response regulator